MGEKLSSWQNHDPFDHRVIFRFVEAMISSSSFERMIYSGAVGGPVGLIQG